jgi:hypothetical protein
MNFGEKSEEGKAEAEATQHSSRATVGKIIFNVKILLILSIFYP